MDVDWLIVGAGFTGCTLAERIATQLGQRVLLVDRRDHVGGNAHDSYDKHGILVHNYGPHIFHSQSERVWRYLSQFTEWRPYFHRVLAVVDGNHIPLPFNLNSLFVAFPPEQAVRLESRLLETYGCGATVPVLRMLEAGDAELGELASYVFKNVFERYTLKQWGMAPRELDASVTARVPISVSRDDRYFQDPYQGMPKHGYHMLFRRMLADSKISVLLNTDHRQIAGGVTFRRMIYTGAADEFFDHAHGRLAYRSLRFDFQHHQQESFQTVGTVNYPNEHDFTRITEMKHLTGQESNWTTTIVEYPEAYEPGVNDAYYPIPRRENQDRYGLYEKEIEKLKRSVLFAGRLADYRYYNMDQAVLRAMKLFEQEVAP